MFKIFKQGLKW